MKKRITFTLVAMMLAALLCACGTSDTEDTTAPSIMLSTEPVETTAATTAPTEETQPTETTIPEEPTQSPTEPTEAETEPAATTALHTHSYTSTVVAPTCSTDGYTQHKCKTCGYSYKSNTSAAYGHAFVYEIHDATTTECGYVLHICRDCDYSYKDNYTDKLPTEHTHSYAATVTAPTCMQYGEGYTTYTCETCGHSYKDNYTPQLEHSMIATGPKEATCITYGLHMTYECTECGFENFDYVTDEPTGHNWGEWVVSTPATTESDGIETRTCETCGATENQILTQLVEVHTHNYISVVTEPTCTEGGYTTYTCSCGDSYTSDETNATGHDYLMPDDTATCTEPGIRTYTCADCGYEEEVEIDANGHKFSQAVIAPTCTDDGYTCYQCIYCDFCEYADFIAPAGHTWSDWITTVAPTVDFYGEEMRTCAACQNVETREIDKLTSAETEPPVTEHIHDYDSCTTLATCTTDGYTTYICKTCSDSYTGDITPAIGHIWGEWTLTKEPSTTEYGKESRSCACGETENREIEKLAESHTHSYTEDVTNPTCTTGGYTTFICACGDSYTGNETDAAGHNWGEWETTVEATTESEGTKVRICSTCGETESQQTEKKTPAVTSDNIYDLVNAARAENGLSPLTYYAEGQQAADIRVAEIAQYFSHTRPDGSDCFTVQSELGLSMFFCGENIAAGYRTNNSVMNAWMNSPGHRANILSAYFSHIAVATDGYYWVMLFFAG